MTEALIEKTLETPPVTSPERVIAVNLGEVYVSKDPDVVLSCVGLGSCIAVCAYDALTKVGGMAHVVLPHSKDDSSLSPKFADVAVPILLSKMREHGAYRGRITVKIVGGAKMGTLDNHIANAIGEKNSKSVKEQLARENIKVEAEDIGGGKGRSVRLYLSSGKVIVKTIGSTGHEL
jgi:chemotaxis protein CheD